MTDEVLARLILRSPSGGFPLDVETRRTYENVGDYRAGEELVHEARRRLAGLGFRVQQADPTGISFAAERTRFEAFFGTRLESRDKTMLSQGEREAKRRYPEATEPIKIPEELADVGAAVVLARPPELFP